jgi:parallel beta-helix repeat protein
VFSRILREEKAMRSAHGTVLRGLRNAFSSPARRKRGHDRIRLLQHEQLELRCVLTLPATQTFAEGYLLAYNGPTVDVVNDTASFDAFIDFAGDVDSYFFAPQFTGSYTFDVGDFGNTVDPEIAVYNASTGAQVGYNDDLSGTNDDARLVLNLIADVRYVVAVADAAATTAGNVSIIVSAPFRSGSFLLSPDAFGDVTTNVLVDVNTDIDYYSITAPAGATGGLSISATASTFNHRFALFNSAGTLLQGPLTSINYLSATPSTEYRVAVFSNSYESSGTLELRVEFAQSGAAVTNTLDSGPGSLRQAILDANLHPNDPGVPDKIRFAIPDADPKIIVLATALPDITEAVEIDGGTQSGTGATPTVTIDGSAATGAIDGLKITADGTVIRKLNIRNFSSDGIQIEASGVRVENNTIGTNAGGLAAFGNSQYGIRILNGSSNQIISNVVSANVQGGIVIIGDTADENVLDGNTIGARFGGTVALPNGNGVVVTDGDLNEISNNVISGNRLSGIVVSGNATTNSFTGNRIGTRLSGNVALPNGGDGIFLQASGNTVGGNDVMRRNVISGNAKSGITISGAGASNNVVEGNVIGANTSGTVAVPNTSHGIRIVNASNNRIGSLTEAGGRNIISGNGGSGVTLSQAGATGSLLAGNYIGVAANGSSALGNSGSGVLLTDGATNVQIGGSTALSRNLISANQSNGISIVSGAVNNRVSRNRIGTTLAGAALGNIGSGIFIQSSGNLIGGANGTFANTIAGNAQGVTLSGAAAVNNIIKFNTIGTDTASNIGNGIQFISGASENIVGPGNTIRRNQKGIVVNNGSVENKVTRNDIAENTNLGIDLIPAAGATANDPFDNDSGGNQLQNWPSIISGILLTATDLEIAFRVPSSPSNSAYPLTIEFFVSDGGGEGAEFLVSTVYTEANFTAGVKTVSFAGAGSGLTSGVTRIVGTATDLNGNTSEFSTQRIVTSGASLRTTKLQKTDLSIDKPYDRALNQLNTAKAIAPLMSVGELNSNGLPLNSGLTAFRDDTSRDSNFGPPDLVTGGRKEVPASQVLSSAKPLDNEAFWGAILRDLDLADLTAVSPVLA